MDHCPLPLELLGHIISLIPSDRIVAYRKQSVETRTIFACLFLCRATFPFAQYTLHHSSLYVSNARRLESLVRSFSAQSKYGLSKSGKRLASYAVVLAPYREAEDFPIISNVAALLTALGPALKRLVLDVPLWELLIGLHDTRIDTITRELMDTYVGVGSDHPNDRRLCCMVILRAVLGQLTGLEEVVSLNDEIQGLSAALHKTGPPVWSSWHNLSRLAIHSTEMDSTLRQGLASLPKLGQVVLSCPRSGGTDCLADLVRSIRPWTTVLFVDTRVDLITLLKYHTIPGRRASDEILPEMTGLCIEDVVNATKESGSLVEEGEPDAHWLIRQWIAAKATDGMLWHQRGIALNQLSAMEVPDYSYM